MDNDKDKDKGFDKRVIEKNIAEEITSKVEYEEYLLNLPDVSDKAEYTPLPEGDLKVKKIKSEFIAKMNKLGIERA
ncbi:MAG: hypothetical protein ABID54_10560 [Pseudomonadota bacterium]